MHFEPNIFVFFDISQSCVLQNFLHNKNYKSADKAFVSVGGKKIPGSNLKFVKYHLDKHFLEKRTSGRIIEIAINNECVIRRDRVTVWGHRNTSVRGGFKIGSCMQATA